MVNVNKILPILLVALILVSAVQAFQLNTLKEKLEGGKLSVSSGSSGPKAAAVGTGSGAGGVIASSGSGASGIADLPTMVGGC